ncbi:LysR substrate-binding domain-containing protein, partial [Pseudomonas alliivorans]|nr:LysR substrate-binding domain-containing protein [Pseudomonas alliivorans]MEE4721993.1 LysR substrate-binding domain-containing protein [Pseudomonas alliivorans]MEE4758209.1 LysR substrate-binding domain-containing protein [Pseudomonas alliivorans]MEE4762562.1 LysR substrate-binding domain-containing protein [Pseudomonas alliivorans]MEE4773714.1 LysR substrate-binding domain-containing protein [Pseudomonas alliivorans]
SSGSWAARIRWSGTFHHICGLVRRIPRQLSLTPAGFDLLGHARRLLASHSTLVLAMHGGALSGRVSLGVPDDYAVPYLVPVLRHFAARFGEVEVTLVCEESTALLAKVDRGEIDLALVTRDAPSRGELLFKEALVWGAAEQHEIWKRSPLPIAVHELGGRLRTEILAALEAQQREYRVVYNSPNVGGQIAAAQSGMAVAVLTRCSLPPTLKVLDARQGLPELPVIEVVLMRSRDSKGSRAVDTLYDEVVGSLRDPLCVERAK